MGAMTDQASRKATIRRLVLARRSRSSAGERAAAGRAVAERVASLPEADRAAAVLGFASFGSELPTDDVMAWVLGSGRRLLIPFVDGLELRAAEVRAIEELAPGYRGIREPVERTPADPNAAGVILVPGVAFDMRGRRLGYGGGFYDSFLKEVDRAIPRVGLCLDLQVVDEVPAGTDDEPVGVVVTEKRVIRAAEA